MIDTLITHAVSGNKSHKSKLETVMLQIVALRAVEAQLNEWIAQSEKEQAAEEKRSTPSDDMMIDVANRMSINGLMRADPQSPEWAGLAVHGLTFGGQITHSQRKHAKRVIEYMVACGVIKKVSVFSARRGRDLPSYEVCRLPTRENTSGKSGD